MGQGSYTGLATILADELDADWARVRVESAPADATRYANLAFGKIQGTGGSSAIANSWPQLRDAGAKARAMLLTAAANEWHVPVGELSVDKSVISHAASKRQATFGSLVKKAAALPVPETVQLKDPKDFKLIGGRPPRVDVAAKCDGTAQFTIDVEMPGMLVALLKRSPRFGGTVKSFDGAATHASARRGQGRAGAARRRRGGEEFLGRQARPRRAQSRLGRFERREAQLRRDDGRVPATRRSAGAARAQAGRCQEGHRRCGPQDFRELRISVSRARADGAAGCRGQARRQELRDLDRRSIPNRSIR